jgi:uncharacterized membrane protein YecN with MAPEG domain
LIRFDVVPQFNFALFWDCTMKGIIPARREHAEALKPGRIRRTSAAGTFVEYIGRTICAVSKIDTNNAEPAGWWDVGMVVAASKPTAAF